MCRMVSLSLAGLFLLTGCQRGWLASPAEMPECALEQVREEASLDSTFEEGPLAPDWWSLFGDSQLSGLIEFACLCNPTLKGAYEAVLFSFAEVERTRAALFPNLFWAGDVSRQKLSETGIIPFGNAQFPFVSAIPVYFTLYESSLNLTYTFDIWHKQLNTVRAALNRVQARAAECAFAHLMLSTSIATTYFELQAHYENHALLKQLVHNHSMVLEKVRRKVGADLSGLFDVHAAEARLDAAKERLVQSEGTIALLEASLHAYLAGDFQEPICPIKVAGAPLPKVPLPKELPLHLLTHRPDILAQLWLIESAGHVIEVARAGFYPDFNIMSLIGFQTIHFKDLVEWPSLYFNVDPAFNLPLFDGGVRLANLRGSEVNYNQAIFTYNEIILQAVQEVVSGFATFQSAHAQQLLMEKRMRAQRENLELMDLRVRANLSSDLDYLASEESWLLARSDWVLSHGATLGALVSVIKALGGGYACDE